MVLRANILILLTSGILGSEWSALVWGVQSQDTPEHTPGNDHVQDGKNSNPLSHPNATLAPQARQARASGENLNYMTLAPQARLSSEILNYSLSCYSDILK